MNIKELLNKKPEEKKYASSFRRSTASMFDLWIVLFLRVIVMQVLGIVWLNAAITNFVQEFYERFGTEVVKNTPEHIDFIVHNRIFLYGIIFYSIVILVGTFYHAYFNSSSWQGTVGKRLMKIMIAKEDGSKISFKAGFAHYFLSVLPFVFIIYLLSYQLRNHLNFYQALTASELNVFLGIVFVIWVQIHLFTKKKTTAYDMICQTFLINGKAVAKFPWTKNN
jgi:uncharacterized RDD family membrane protein YckC